MGFREGEGLGKYGQGRKDIVEASSQKGRRGFGLTLKGFDGELNIDWQDEPEVSTSCFESLFCCCVQDLPSGNNVECCLIQVATMKWLCWVDPVLILSQNSMAKVVFRRMC